MRHYMIMYIDGHDLRCRITFLEAKGSDDAVKKLRQKYPDGDFDHQIIEVKEMKK